MKRANVGVVSLGFVAALVALGCGGGSSSNADGGVPEGKRHVSAKLTMSGTYTASDGRTITPRALDVIKAQLKGRAALRAKQSPAFAKQLAKRWTRLGAHVGVSDRLRERARESGKHPLDVVFEDEVAVFAWDDYNGEWLDAQYLDPDTGEFDLVVDEVSPVSVWVGTYDEVVGEAAIVAPMTYGFDYLLPPDEVDYYWDYDPYFWADPVDVGWDLYDPGVNSQEGYYELAYTNDDGTSGVAWFYLLPDAPEYGSYYLIWDDGTCVNGTQIYVSFDASGFYYSANGVDAPLSFSGETGSAGWLEGAGRMNVVGDDGLTYYADFQMTYLGMSPATIDDLCPVETVVVPADPVVYTDGCFDCCPPGCEVDEWFGICVISGTYNYDTGIGESCDLIDVFAPLTLCPLGCEELYPSDGFCYAGGDPFGDICI